MENIYDRGNISAAMRSAEAFGFCDFHIVEFKNKKFKEANRVTQGTDKWLNISRFDNPSDCAKSLKAKGFQIFATHLEAAAPISEVDFSNPTAIVFGNEKAGVSAEMLDVVDGQVIIPMHGFAQSFNISVAAALSFYHAYQERVRRLGRSGDLSAEDKKRLLANYLVKTVMAPGKLLKRLKVP
jgi:tRNA (guanosine-2'-O-)-methyltransferase